MLVKSPMKKKDVKKNQRKSSSKQKKSRKNPGASHGRRVKKDKSRFSFPNIAPWKVIIGVIITGLLGMLYLNHVFATQELLSEVQQLEQQYNQAKRAHDSYRLQYDRMIGPAEISEKAKSMGFINGGPAEKVIEVESQ